MTYDIPQEIRRVLERMASQLLDLFRRGMIESLEGEDAAADAPTLGAVAPKRRGRPPKNPVSAQPAATPKTSKTSKTSKAPKTRRTRQPRISDEEVEQVGHEITALLKEHEGKFLTAKDIRTRLSVEEKPFRQALDALKASKAIALQGARRSARYGLP